MRSRFNVMLILAAALSAGCEDDNDVTGGNQQLTGQRIYAIDDANNLVLFGSASASTISRRTAITGLQAGESVVGIDFRPTVATSGAASDVGVLFGLTSGNRLIRIDTMTAAATVTGAIAGGTLNGTSFGFDFNPSVDRIRVHSDAVQNLRLNQTVSPPSATVDTIAAYVTGDAGFGSTASLVGSAYTPASFGSSTQLFAIDAGRDVLVLSERPNGGTLRTVAALPMATNGNVGFDITSAGIGFVALTSPGATRSQLYQIASLTTTTPVFTSVGPIGAVIRALAVAP